MPFVPQTRSWVSLPKLRPFITKSRQACVSCHNVFQRRHLDLRQPGQKKKPNKQEEKREWLKCKNGFLFNWPTHNCSALTHPSCHPSMLLIPPVCKDQSSNPTVAVSADGGSTTGASSLFCDRNKLNFFFPTLILRDPSRRRRWQLIKERYNLPANTSRVTFTSVGHRWEICRCDAALIY